MIFSIEKEGCQPLERGFSNLQKGIKLIEALNSTMDSTTLSQSLEIFYSSEKDLKKFYATLTSSASPERPKLSFKSQDVDLNRSKKALKELESQINRYSVDSYVNFDPEYVKGANYLHEFKETPMNNRSKEKYSNLPRTKKKPSGP